jgi:hypothetical protein
LTFSGLHGIAQKTELFITTTVRTSILQIENITVNVRIESSDDESEDSGSAMNPTSEEIDSSTYTAGKGPEGSSVLGVQNIEEIHNSSSLFFFFQWPSIWGHLAPEESCIPVQFINFVLVQP